MRGLVAVEMVSLDGVMGAPDAWASPYSDGEVAEASAAGMAGRTLSGHLGAGPIELGSTRVIEGAGVTRLTFRVVGQPGGE